MSVLLDIYLSCRRGGGESTVPAKLNDRRVEIIVMHVNDSDIWAKAPQPRSHMLVYCCGEKHGVLSKIALHQKSFSKSSDYLTVYVLASFAFYLIRVCLAN